MRPEPCLSREERRNQLTTTPGLGARLFHLSGQAGPLTGLFFAALCFWSLGFRVGRSWSAHYLPGVVPCAVTEFSSTEDRLEELDARREAVGE